MSAPALRVIEHHFAVYRRTWRGSVMSSFLTPVFFLASVGLGLGGYVDKAGGNLMGGVPYVLFLAPGLLASTAMQTAAFESAYPVMARIVWDKTYDGQLATPLRIRDILAGDLAWVALRLAFVTAVFLGIMAVFGAVQSPLALLAIPAAVLTGMAFAAPIFAISATLKDEASFNVLFRFGITPLFLFSGTFFPVEQLPEAVRLIAFVTPLYHGVALTRGLALATLDLPSAALHLGVLAVFLVAGLIAASIRFEKRLAK